MNDLESVFDGEPTETVEDEAVGTTVESSAEPETPEVVAESDLGNGVVDEPTGETEEAPQETSSPEVETGNDQVEGFKAGFIAERRKRQEAEAALRAAQQQRQQQPEDFWQNPEGTLQNMQRAFQGEINKTRIDMSVELMRGIKDDYDEKEQQFFDMADRNPTIVHQMNQSANPAKFVYDYVTTQNKIAEMQSPDYEEKLKAKLRAEIEAESQEKIEAEIKKRTTLPGTIAGERASGGNAQPQWEPPSSEALYDS